MTEEEWLNSGDPTTMLIYLGKQILSRRKLRLFGCGCCDRVSAADWPRRSLQAIRAAENFADGAMTDRELNRHRSLACQAAQDYWLVISRNRNSPSPDTRERHSHLTFVGNITANDGVLTLEMTNLEQAIGFRHDRVLREMTPLILRDIFGNPFRPVAFEPAWRTETAVGIATGIYEDRAFERMPILADALQDAGCEHPDILTHCREPGTHVRGCWVVDLVLGKA